MVFNFEQKNNNSNLTEPIANQQHMRLSGTSYLQEVPKLSKK